jgi:hypothetical protein
MTPFWKKTLLFASLAIVLGYVGVRWGESYIKQRVEAKIANNGVLKYSRMDINLLAGDVSFKDAAINIKWEEQAKFFSVRTPEIRVEGIGWRRLYFDKKLVVGAVHIESPDLTVMDTAPADSLAKTAETPADTTDSLIKVIALELNSVTINNGCVEIFKGTKGQPEALLAFSNDVKLDLSGIGLNLQGDVMNSLVFEDADALLNNIAVNDRSSRHHFTLQQFHLSKQDSLIEVVDLHLDPKDKPSEFFNQMSFREAWIDISLPSARLNGWQFDKMIGGALVARTLDVEGLEMKVRVNQNLQPDPNGYKPMPQEMLRKLPMTVYFDSVLVNNGHLLFENIGPGKTEVGVITFDPINAQFSNFTNDTAHIAQQKIMELTAVGHIQGKHPFINHFWFDLASPANAFSFKGNASNIPFVSLNSFIKPSTDVFFDEGTINSIKFEANADDKRATGNLKMDFSDLHFSLLNQDRERRKVLSKVVDFLFIKSGNDKSDEGFQKGEIHANRDVRLSFLNYWWSSIQSGIKTTLLDGMMLDQVNKRMAKRADKR